MTQLLIVDDEAQIASGIADMLDWEELGVQSVHKANSAGQALELMAVYPIGIVLTDIRMPEMDGIALLHRIREKWKRTKVIILSGYADFEYAQGAIKGQACGYLLKPVRKETLRETISEALEEMRREWEEVASVRKAMFTLRTHLPELKAKLLSDLAGGIRFPAAALQEKLDWFSLPFAMGDDCLLLIVRPEMPARDEDMNSRALMEYALENIAQEGFGDEFALWSCRDAHGHLVFLIKPCNGEAGTETQAMEKCAIQFHHHAKQYLQIEITVFAGAAGKFPHDVCSMYEQTLSAVRSLGAETERFLVRVGRRSGRKSGFLRRLQEPPLLQHLFEVGRWDAAEGKMREVFADARQMEGDAGEHAAELFFAFSNALCACLHKQGKAIADVLGDFYDPMADGTLLRSRKRLEDWVFGVIKLLQAQVGEDPRRSRSELVGQIQRYVESRLSEELSLPGIADHVFMHPTHLSKVYKQETGEGISEYVSRLRLEKAVHLLSTTDVKIYEVGCQVGYMNANYFIKVFRKQFGVTPQEYRDKIRLARLSEGNRSGT